MLVRCQARVLLHIYTLYSNIFGTAMTRLGACYLTTKRVYITGFEWKFRLFFETAGYTRVVYRRAPIYYIYNMNWKGRREDIFNNI